MSFGHPYILNVDGCIHDGWLVLEKPTSFDTNFMYYLLSSDKTYKEFSKRAKGAVVNNLNIELVSSVLVSYPPLSEQSAIASELDNLQTVIDGYKAQLADLDALAQSVFLEMFGDPVANDKGWETNLLSEKCKIFGRIGFRGYTKNDFVDTSKDGCITLSPSNIDGLSVTYEKCSYITWHKYDESPEIQIFNGDILVVKTGSSYGKCALVRNLPHPATINPQFVVLKQVKCNNVFLVFQLATKHAKNQYDSFVGGAAIPTFSQANMRKMTFPFPPLPLQTQFASRVEAIEKQKEQIRQQLKDAETLMAERMQYYFG